MATAPGPARERRVPERPCLARRRRAGSITGAVWRWLKRLVSRDGRSGSPGLVVTRDDIVELTTPRADAGRRSHSPTCSPRHGPRPRQPCNLSPVDLVFRAVRRRRLRAVGWAGGTDLRGASVRFSGSCDVKRLWVLAIGTAALAATGCGAATSTTTRVPAPTTTTTATNTAPAGSGTRHVTYQPFTAQGTIDPSLRVTATMNATCVTRGLAGTSSYRCLAQSSVRDPCYARPGATSGPLVCPSNPATPEVVELTVTSLPAPAADAPREWPWAIQLSNGHVCRLAAVASNGLGPFGCQGASLHPADCLFPEQGTPWWTAACQDQRSDSSPYSNYRIDTVWF